MEMGQAMVASRVSGRLLSDFPGMTSLFGGVHACAGSSVRTGACAGQAAGC